MEIQIVTTKQQAIEALTRLRRNGWEWEEKNPEWEPLGDCTNRGSVWINGVTKGGLDVLNLGQLLSNFLDFKQASVETGESMPKTYRDPDEMQAVFEESLGDLVHAFVESLDWEEIYQDHIER